MNIGYNIKGLREKADMTQEELGKRIGTSKMWISLVERGLEKLDIIRLEQIADVFNVTIDEIVRGKQCGKQD